ncbi:riboflavin kinase [Halobacteriales archaeon QS_9_67_15]|nr:MAG: riboflavin kinase [Halobacteriales archaeon QS_9_67_15]
MTGVTASSAGHAELATLKALALQGGLDGDQKVSCSALAERLDASTQTASRRLQRLEEADLVEREIVSDGQWVTVTATGQRVLQREYTDYRRIFERDASVELHGSITSGMGEGRHYISLPGYMRQFEEKLGYEPFLGTLNVELTDESARERGHLTSFEPITVEGWEDDERTYGPAYCYPASLSALTASSPSVSQENVSIFRTTGGLPPATYAEAMKNRKTLRDELALEDGSALTIHVSEQR